MEELFELRSHIEQGRYHDALILLGEMEEMSKDDKINKIRGYIIIILLHIIKQYAEKCSTRSWELSVYNSLKEITYINKRRKAKGFYLGKDEIKETIEEAWEQSLKNASIEAFGGVYSEVELARMIDEEKIKKEALHKILEFQGLTI